MRCGIDDNEGEGLFIASELDWFVLGLCYIVLHRDIALSLELWFGMSRD